MSIVRCAVQGCFQRVRQGLIRPTYEGSDKADGRRCWRCRAGQRKHLVFEVKPGDGAEFRPSKRERDLADESLGTRERSGTDRYPFINPTPRRRG